MRISSMKRTAKDKLKGNWGSAILLLVVYGVLELIIQLILPIPANLYYYDKAFLSFEETLPFGAEMTIGLIAMIFSAALTCGLLSYFLHLVREENRTLSDLFFYFKNGKQFIRSAGIIIISTIFTMLWSLLLIVPGIIKATAYSQVAYIIKDYPEMKVLDAITLSRRMMNGYKWKYVLLNLSFIGWFLLFLITFGLAGLYVMPYYYALLTEFYVEVKEKYETVNLNGEIVR